MKVANIIIFISLVIFVCSAAISQASSRAVLQLNARIPASIEVKSGSKSNNSDFSVRSNNSNESITVKKQNDSKLNHQLYTVTVN